MRGSPVSHWISLQSTRREEKRREVHCSQQLVRARLCSLVQNGWPENAWGLRRVPRVPTYLHSRYRVLIYSTWYLSSLYGGTSLYTGVANIRTSIILMIFFQYKSIMYWCFHVKRYISDIFVNKVDFSIVSHKII